MRCIDSGAFSRSDPAGCTSDFQERAFGRSTILADITSFPQADPRIFSPAYWQSKKQLIGSASGRGTTHFFTHQESSFVLRHYYRGGFVGKWLSDRYLLSGLKNTRPWREIALLRKLQDFGLPAPVPVCAMVTRSGLHYRGDIITRWIPDSRDVFAILCHEPLPEEIWERIGATIRQFHDRGVSHADLNVRNLVLEALERVWLIDFDKCGRRNGAAWKEDNLRRLLRSLHKEKARQPLFHWSENQWRSLMAGYLRAV